ncbi:MAG: YraN family protein [Clostridiales bacterium]|jgi:putative endonuclease|nr:YraN family protein [Clostridiales bacterium]
MIPRYKGAAAYVGAVGEDLAARFLLGSGYKILETQFRSPYGEIDIIAKDDDYIVFVEVKYRATIAFGSPGAAVTKSKREKIIKTAMSYISKNPDENFRFDVIEIQKYNFMNIEHIKNAFTVD